MNPIWTLDSVKKHVERATRRAVEIHADLVDVFIGIAATGVGANVESPLEAIVLAWFHALATGNEFWQEFDLQPQHKVVIDGKGYRLDFALDYLPRRGEVTAERLAAAGLAWPRFAVEVDGHDYHERTKEQVIRRNTRDRDLQAGGWIVFHFSGSELHRDPESCIESVMKTAGQRVNDTLAALYRSEAQRSE